LRYKVDFAEIADAIEQGDEDEFYDSDDDFI
jgi:peptide chain release factor subunit 1